MAFVRYKKRGNKLYAYKVVAFWDKSSKKPKQKKNKSLNQKKQQQPTFFTETLQQYQAQEKN